ncbi:MAG: GNAT family N-acetyltransferase [Ruminococcaceae bacterium]|nr:GNAT family N-acetyltransferase [Oscillospiraceae bacterium]
MSSLKMYNFNPKVRGKALPEGFIVTKYKGDEDIPAWCEICSDGLIDPATAEERFYNELTKLDGPDPMRDTYFIEKDGKKIATYTVVPNMWSTGMGYIHMVAVKSEYRSLGLGSFIADDSLSKLIAMGKDKVFLLTGDKREAALSTYIKAGFLPVNYIDDENKDMVERWQNIVNNLKLKELTLLDNEGNFLMTLKQSE